MFTQFRCMATNFLATVPFVAIAPFGPKMTLKTTRSNESHVYVFLVLLSHQFQFVSPDGVTFASCRLFQESTPNEPK